MHEYLEKSLSKQRVATYEQLATQTGEKRTAEELYRLNILYSKELYVVLGGLEITIRNRFHRALAHFYNKEDWFSLNLLHPKHQLQINTAIDHLVKTKKSNYVVDDIIAQLSFGFWIHLCDRPYEKTLWNKVFFSCFPYLGKKPDRAEMEKNLNACLRLRNKIAHLEPIIKYEATLIQEYRNMSSILYAMCPDTQKWFNEACRFENIWNERYKGY